MSEYTLVGMRSNDAELAAVARMIGEPARAAMLYALMGGVALPAGALARQAQVSPATASAHLARLVNAGLVARTPRGRQRLYSLASSDVAAALEALARLTPVRTHSRADEQLRFARTCYDHLAGKLGVQLTDHLVAHGMLTGAGLELSERGSAWLRSWNIDVDALRAARRPLTRPCLDWTERRDHLAGSAGAAIVTTMIEHGWLVRLDGTRAVRLTLRGREALFRSLHLEVAL
ncbi:MAG TPA: helix-turn-helix domain-containing protein [Longimicrobiales bacterium]